MDRKKFIGGSDIAAVVGSSRWKTPLQLWAEKTGKVEEEEMTEAAEMGNELEETVARLFTKRTGIKVRRSPKRYVHKDYDYMACQIDRLVEGEDELLECKTCSAWKYKEWEGEDDIPNEYILQVTWQLGITGRKTGWIAVLIGGQNFKYKKIEFDKELFEMLVQKAVEFYKMCEDETPPVATAEDSDFIKQLHPESQEDIQEVKELDETVDELQAVKRMLKDLEVKKADCEAKIKQRIGDSYGIQTEQYQASWPLQSMKRVDIKKMKDVGIYEDYLSETKTRVLRIKKKKEIKQ